MNFPKIYVGNKTCSNINVKFQDEEEDEYSIGSSDAENSEADLAVVVEIVGERQTERAERNTS